MKSLTWYLPLCEFTLRISLLFFRCKLNLFLFSISMVTRCCRVVQSIVQQCCERIDRTRGVACRRVLRIIQYNGYGSHSNCWCFYPHTVQLYLIYHIMKNCWLCLTGTQCEVLCTYLCAAICKGDLWLILLQWRGFPFFTVSTRD